MKWLLDGLLLILPSSKTRCLAKPIHRLRGDDGERAYEPHPAASARVFIGRRCSLPPDAG